MSRWTHSACEKDYEKITGYSATAANRIKEPEREICCFCREFTMSGLYIRYNPERLQFCSHDKIYSAYTIILDDFYGGHAVGPFETWDEADKYYKENHCIGKIRPLVTPPPKLR